MPAPRTGSIAKKPTSARPLPTVSTDFAAATTTMHCSGVPSRRASSRAMSTETPCGSPVVSSRRASMGLPMLMVARSVPVGARAATMDSVDIDGAIALVVHDVVVAFPAAKEDRWRQGYHRIMQVVDESFHQRAGMPDAIDPFSAIPVVPLAILRRRFHAFDLIESGQGCRRFRERPGRVAAVEVSHCRSDEVENPVAVAVDGDHGQHLRLVIRPPCGRDQPLRSERLMPYGIPSRLCGAADR